MQSAHAERGAARLRSVLRAEIPHAAGALSMARLDAWDRADLQRLVLYWLRPAFAPDQLARTSDSDSLVSLGPEAVVERAHGAGARAAGTALSSW